MILIGESGSTKTAWNIADSKGNIKKLINTTGINPVLMSTEEMESAIRPIVAELEKSNPDTIYFFGAGCGSSKIKEEVGQALSNIFRCTAVFVESDLMAACIALCGEQAGIVAILGTGSNSCLWNGKSISEQTPSLGFILGDEGSGSYMGKILVSDFLKKKMPLELRLKFQDTYDINPEIAIERTYRALFPNRYLAGFAPFISKNITHEYCWNLVKTAFHAFLSRNIENYSQSNLLPINFTGSVAYGFKDLLTETCMEHGFIVGRIEKEPIDLLSINLLKQ